MDVLNGKMIACQILVTGLIARVANGCMRAAARDLEFFQIRAISSSIDSKAG
jgi:hypothetical protein